MTADEVAAHEAEELARELPVVRTWAVVVAAIVLLGALAGLFLLGWVPRRDRLAALATATTARDARPTVDVVAPRPTARTFELRLPADVRPLQETAIYPRASGLLKQLLVDLGDHVKEGQLLAVIDAPEVDAALLQAKAAEQQAAANLLKAQNDVELNDSTLKRWTDFSTTGGVTQQQLDEKRSAATQSLSALAAAKANVAATQADVQRYAALQDFQHVTAPFAGIVTSRNLDVGALLSPTDTGAGKELFHLEQTDTLRVFVNVPQAWSTSIPTGGAAILTLRSHPGREFSGQVTRTAGAVDATTRTLRVQVEVQNPDGAIQAGSFGEIRLQVNATAAPVVVPTSAVVADASGTHVWVVEANRARAQKVTLGLDFGTEVEIASGLSGKESVVTNPGQRLQDGGEVRLAVKEAKETGAAPGGKP